MCEYNSLSTKCLLTSLTSSISKILFNKKFNYVICYDEDDNIHIVDLATKNVNQYKSENKCSIKNGVISKDDKYLLLLGTDGQLNIYEFNSLDTKNTALILKNSIKNFLPKNILENKNWDGIFDSNEKGIFISGGELLLKIIDLNSNEFKSDTSTDFTCLNEINIAKFVNEDIILLCDIKNNIKIFNYKQKKLIMKFDCSKENEGEAFDSLDYVLNKDEKDNNLFNIELIYGDKSGNLKISEKINISKKMI
jgi:WD40 repeat protein